MQLLELLKDEAKSSKAKILLNAMLSGMANGMLIVVINGAAENYAKGEWNFRYLLMFILCISIFIITKKEALNETSLLIQHAIYSMRLRLIEKVKNSNLRSIEEVGTTKIFTVLKENTEMIFEGARMMVSACSAAVMLTFSFLYIAYLSKTAFLLTLIFSIAGVVVYLSNQAIVIRQLNRTIEKEKSFANFLNHLLMGFKEIKVNKLKSDDLYENYLAKTALNVKDLKVKAEYSFISNVIFSQILFYILMASIVFILPQMSFTTAKVIMDITIVILFIIGPLGTLVDSMPIVAKSNIILTTISDLEKELEGYDDMKYTKSDTIERILQNNELKEIVFDGVFFKYFQSDGKTFSVGPINLTIRVGEIIFIVGGNGSGKTTLMKLICGLYYPESGNIYLNGIPINQTNYAHYRMFFSTIFSDFHLFDRLYGMQNISEAALQKMLNKMELDKKTAYINKMFTNINLSTGQKKRLALTSSMMEEKPVYILDEVAADQDPSFREYYYQVILKELKNDGRAIIVVSHDDRYFKVADRVVKMDYGKITVEKTIL